MGHQQPAPHRRRRGTVKRDGIIRRTLAVAALVTGVAALVPHGASADGTHDLEIVSATASPTVLQHNQLVTFTVLVRNNGPDPVPLAPGETVRLVLTPDSHFTDQSVTTDHPASRCETRPALSCDLGLASGQQATVRFVSRAIVTGTETRTRRFTVYGVGHEDPNQLNNERLVPVSLVATPDPGGGSGTGTTINGTAGNDTLIGTPGNDVINCGGGDDTVIAGAGNDVINCGPGNDRIDAGLGNDRASGDTGNDSIDGGDGADTVSANEGNDTVSGAAGNDRIFGNEGNDKANGNSGNDRLSGGSGKDRLSGAGGRDVIGGGTANDRLDGGSGNDRLAGDGGRDVLFGRAGNDRLRGGPGKDRLNGGPGRDSSRQ